MAKVHLGEELPESKERVQVETRFGPVTGGRAKNGAAVFLEIPYALPPTRFEDPTALPADYRYAQKEYILENAYAAQPLNDGQAVGTPFEDKVGLGRPTENPLFVNIVIPPEFPSKKSFPVKLYIHGGFLQFGSPHGLGSQAQYVSAERSEVWVNIGYRLSAFGFLACDEPKVDGNFGFKDQWLALEWIRDNIEAFGGNPNDIQLTGLSAGAHSVHQLLHRASRLPAGVKAPFHSAILQSNALVTNPKRPSELRPQFHTLCQALGLNPDNPDVLTILKDEKKVPWETITSLITEEKLGLYGTFRGSMDGTWLSDTPDPMTWQRSGGLARGLLEHGVRSVVIGTVSEEWYLYSIAHPIKQKSDILTNMKRYYPEDVTEKLVKHYADLPEDSDPAAFQRLFGEMLSDGQVYLPVRLLHRDLQHHGYPVVRYEIRWTPEQLREKGYVTHATDRSIWALRRPALEPSQVEVAKAWLDTIASTVRDLESGAGSGHGLDEVLTLEESKKIGRTKDARWEELMKLSKVLPGEG
ncbi:carboxylesterase [Dentipellis sp. KUC8613]|nr:carboxylesterase [Dentipellis sp. KUC8613]